MEQNLVDAEVIDKLGGGRQLSSQLSNVSKLDLNEKTVYSWKQQGIPDKWRIAVAKLLIEKKIDFPSNFLPHRYTAGFPNQNFHQATTALAQSDSLDSIVLAGSMTEFM